MIRTSIFLGLAVLYFFGCVYGVTAANDVVIEYIVQNGWGQFDYTASITGTGLGIIIAVLVGSRIWMKRPTLLETGVGVIGFAGTYYVLTQFVLLTTEYVHIPQFIVLTLLLCMAFPNQLINAVIFSVIGCIADEWVQAWLPDRRLDINDVFLNLIGMYFGLVIWWCICGIVTKLHSKDLSPEDGMQETETG